ncbi:DUF427 domain-containing protein [Mumia zhuanghuii]|uniref:DUF427 domain-containing protein n=2 Tax=Mumia TaxID=1546255 RepID=A0ABW1QMS8_9ACTN|nr:MULTISPECIES: DUF427 domain-containing protein [Mumia]KAA1419933.1 DUF427 domain-containing protein [Mumia zhuanghuii]
MAIWVREANAASMSELRVHRVPQRVRASVDGATIVDTTSAVLVWEPRRVVASYAVPVSDLAASLEPPSSHEAHEHAVRMDAGMPPVLDPSSGFGVHTTAGSAYDVRTASRSLPGAAFAPDDPALRDHVVLDWAAFDAWFEEDEEMVGHPHDPFSRIDCLRSSRHVVISVDGQVLADSRRPVMLLETWLPVRYYLPWEDVSQDLLTPTETTSVCAYKGTAAYWSATTEAKTHRNIAWSYAEPRHDALPVRDLVAFFDERVDRVVDGVPLDRPVTPWS